MVKKLSLIIYKEPMYNNYLNLSKLSNNDFNFCILLLNIRKFFFDFKIYK